MLLLLTVGSGLAQDVPDMNVQLYRPPIDAEDTLWTDDAFTAPDGYTQARVFFHYANDPLIFRYEDGAEVAVLSSLLQADVIGAYTIKGFRIGLDLPVMLVASGQSTQGGGLGDVALDAKYTLLNADIAPLGVGIGGRLTLPTATTSAPLGSPGLSGELQAMVSQRLGPTTLAANLGTRFLPPTSLDNVQWDDQLLYRLGAGYEIIDGTGLSVDLAGQLSYAEGLSNPAGSPAEFLLGGWYRLPRELMLRGGIGAGLNSGLGAPDSRVVLSLGYEPAKVFDRDLDGISDKDDGCPDTPEDIDQFRDTDGCPDPSTAVYFTIEDSSGELIEGATASLQTEYGTHAGGGAFDLSIHPGEYSISATADRYTALETVITVPQAESHEVRLAMAPTFGTLRIRLRDVEGARLSGRVAVGADRGRIEEGQGELEVDAGTGTLVVSAEGYKSQNIDVNVVAGEVSSLNVVMEVAQAVVKKDRIEILDKVYFDTNKTTIKPESFPLLDEVAGLLKMYPDITLLRIEGHTDARGSASTNQRLSQGRAEAVRQYLIEAGIDGDRLTSRGYGEDQPVETGSTEAAWGRNRRVELVIIEREGGNEAEGGQ